MVKRARRKADRHPTGAQLRAARGLLNMSVAQLAELTSLALNTVKRAEAVDHAVPLTPANATLLVTKLEGEGIEFIDADGQKGAGVRLSKPEGIGERPQRRRRRRPSASEVDGSMVSRDGVQVAASKVVVKQANVFTSADLLRDRQQRKRIAAIAAKQERRDDIQARRAARDKKSSNTDQNAESGED